MKYFDYALDNRGDFFCKLRLQGLRYNWFDENIVQILTANILHTWGVEGEHLSCETLHLFLDDFNGSWPVLSYLPAGCAQVTIGQFLWMLDRIT